MKNSSVYCYGYFCLARLHIVIFILDTTSPLMTFRANLTPATIMSKWHSPFSKMPEFEERIKKLQVCQSCFSKSVFSNKLLFRVNWSPKLSRLLGRNASGELLLKAIEQLHTLLLTIAAPGSVISRMKVSRTRHLSWVYALDLSRIEHWHWFVYVVLCWEREGFNI